MIEDTSMFDDDSYDWDDCDSVVMDTIGVSENPFEKEKANVKETSGSPVNPSASYDSQKP